MFAGYENGPGGPRARCSYQKWIMTRPLCIVPSGLSTGFGVRLIVGQPILDLYQQLRMPFADLHRHLDGSMRPWTLIHLAHDLGLSLPSDLGFRPRTPQYMALNQFSFAISLLQEPAAVRRVAAETCKDASDYGTDALELRFAPQLHMTKAPLEAMVDAALEGIDGRAGLILCGLHGEHPAVLEGLVDVAIPRPGVVGIDLAGSTAPQHTWKIPDYVPAFRHAEEHGIGRTVHAGEGGPASEIRDAIQLLHAQRIGHGTTMLCEPGIAELVVEREVTIEVCLTSNVHTGVLRDATEHPLPRWLDRGVRVTLGTDNTFFSATSSEEEHALARLIPEMTIERLRQIVAWGHAAAFKRR